MSFVPHLECRLLAGRMFLFLSPVHTASNFISIHALMDWSSAVAGWFCKQYSGAISFMKLHTDLLQKVEPGMTILGKLFFLAESCI